MVDSWLELGVVVSSIMMIFWARYDFLSLFIMANPKKVQTWDPTQIGTDYFPILSFPLIAVPKRCRKVFPVGLYDEVTGYCYTASKSMLHIYIYIYNCTNNNNTVIIMMIITIYDRLLSFWLLYPNMSHAISIIYIH